MWVVRTPPASVSVSPVEPWPAGATEITAHRASGGKCGLRSGSQPAPRPAAVAGCHAAGFDDGGDRRARTAHRRVSTRTPIRSASGIPATGQLEGFDIDIAREIARRHLRRSGPHRPASGRMRANENPRCSPVRWTWWCGPTRSPVNARQIVDFSTVYFYANQKILAAKGSGIDSAAALSGKRVCSVSGTTSLSKLFELNPRPTDVRGDHLDGLPPDAAAGTGRRDQHRRRGAERAGQTGPERGRGRGQHRPSSPTASGSRKSNEDLVRFVNGVLEQIRDDGTWQRLYDDLAAKSSDHRPVRRQPRYQD